MHHKMISEKITIKEKEQNTKHLNEIEENECKKGKTKVIDTYWINFIVF